MANHQFTETTSTGWFSRIGKSIKGVLVGIIFILISVVLLWWNEGRSVKTARGLAEGAKITVEARAESVDPGQEGMLVHVSGKTALTGPAADAMFGVTAPDLIKLRRSVEIFQWIETKKETTTTRTGGSEETVTEYSYATGWDDDIHNSSDFRHPEGHQNPPPASKSEDFQAQTVSLGAFRLPTFLLEQWNDFSAHPLPDPQKLPEDLRGLASVRDGWLVLSKSPNAPSVGDVRVQFEAIKTGEASVLARQVKDTFEEYLTSHGTGISRITSGVVSKDAMFAAAQAENTMMAWLLRLIGFVVMFVGTAAVLNPLKVLADVLPLAGKVVGAGTGLVAFLISSVGSLTIIALSWLWYRPFLGVTLLVVAVGGLYLLNKAMKPKAA